MTTLFDIIPRADLDRALAERLVNIRSDGAGLRILNYSDAAMYTPGSWSNPAVRTCRGVIVDDAWNVVARPWSKFFNHGQDEAGDLNLTAPVEVTDKLDGSLGIIHLALDGTPRVASRGSFESDQATYGTAFLDAGGTDLLRHRHVLDTLTPLVEIIYPANRIVVDYGDFESLVLLGAVEIATGRALGPLTASVQIGWQGDVTDVMPYDTLRDALDAPPRRNAEGLCVRYRDEPQRIVKIKQEDYVRLHKIVTGLSERTVWEHMSAGKPLEEMLAPLPDELHDWTRHVWSDLTWQTDVVERRARDEHQKAVTSLGEGEGRAEYAAIAKTKAPLTPYMFQLLDGRDPRPAILRTLKPAGDTRAKAVSEAVA